MAENTEMAQAKAPKKNDKSTDSILDVFTSDDDEESAISRLSRDLGDVSIDSLLEQTKKIAEDIGCGL